MVLPRAPGVRRRPERHLIHLLVCVSLASVLLLVRLSAIVAQPGALQLITSRQQQQQQQAHLPSSPLLMASETTATSNLPACEAAAHIGHEQCFPRRVIFVGGLQRSGTSTLAALLDNLPGAAGLQFDPSNAMHMEAAPWKRLVDVHTGRWMKWAYFKEVISTGGAEGKLLQSVFPYRYAVWDAKFSQIPALLAQPSALSPLLTNSSREALWKQWRRFWTPGAALVDKSPENVLMGPFLQAMFGRARTSFVFVMRHPLSWALVAAKWGCKWQPLDSSIAVAPGATPESLHAEGAQAKAPTLECLAHLVDVWLGVHERLHDHLPTLASAVLLPAESDQWLTAPTWLEAVGQGALPRSLAGDTAHTWNATQQGFREASHSYVHCFLKGYAARRTRVVDGRCADRGVRQSTESQRYAWLSRLEKRVGSRVRALGYRMTPSESVGRQCCKSSWDDWRADGSTVEVNVLETKAGDAAVGLPHAAASLRYAREANSGEDVGIHTGGVALIVSTNFLSAFNGMQQRAAQLVAAVGKLGYALHYVSIGTLNSTAECDAAPVAIICHASGDEAAQYAGFVEWARASRAVPSLVLFGFTSLTLEVSRALLRLPKRSFEQWRPGGGYDPMQIPKAHRCMMLLDAAATDFPTAAPVVFTDDIHFQRSLHILALAGRASPLSAHMARVLEAAKAFELKIYARARLVLLISNTDRESLMRALPPSGADSGSPALAVLPFGAAPLADAEVAPLARRDSGRMLFVGTCHPVAKASVTWFVRFVLPGIVKAFSRARLAGRPELRIAGNGWAALAGDLPYAQWIARGNLRIVGKLSPPELEAEYSAARLFVSPLLNATGIATKNFHAMAHGLPVLTTPIGIAGLHLPTSPVELCCEAHGGRAGSEPVADALRPAYCSRDAPAPAEPRRPTLAEDCQAFPSRMECTAWAAAGGSVSLAPKRGRGRGNGKGAGSWAGGDGRGSKSGMPRGRGVPHRGGKHLGGRHLLTLAASIDAGLDVEYRSEEGDSQPHPMRELQEPPNHARDEQKVRQQQQEEEEGGDDDGEAEKEKRQQRLKDEMSKEQDNSGDDAHNRRHGEGGGLVAAVPLEDLEEGEASQVKTTAPLKVASLPGVHPSGTLLVADSPNALVNAAMLAMGNDGVWQSVSRYGLRHQRMLSNAVQSNVLARGLAGGDLQVRLPAERACAIMCDRCESGHGRSDLRRMLAQLTRLRIAVHVIMLPAAREPSSEQRVMGGLNSPGVFFYTGSAHEQWTAMRAAEPYPPISFVASVQKQSAGFRQLASCLSRLARLPIVEELPIVDGLGTQEIDAAWTSVLSKTFAIPS